MNIEHPTFNIQLPTLNKDVAALHHPINYEIHFFARKDVATETEIKSIAEGVP